MELVKLIGEDFDFLSGLAPRGNYDVMQKRTEHWQEIVNECARRQHEWVSCKDLKACAKTLRNSSWPNMKNVALVSFKTFTFIFYYFIGSIS
jgi:hypothetical protein